MKQRMRATTCYLEARQLRQLKELGKLMRVPVAELIRQGIDKILERKEQEDGAR